MRRHPTLTITVLLLSAILRLLFALHNAGVPTYYGADDERPVIEVSGG